jgi:putative hydrolase of the HAD superfamily
MVAFGDVPETRENALFLDFSNTITTVDSEDMALTKYLEFVKEKNGIADGDIFVKFRQLRSRKLVDRERDFRTFVEINKEVLQELYHVPETYDEDYFQFHEKYLELREDFVPFVRLARKKVKVVMITDADNIYTERTIGALGIKRYFDAIVTAEEVRSPKPFSPIFKKGLELAGNPKKIIHVGDSERRDIEGARAMGFFTVLMNNDGKPTNANATVHNFRELMTLLMRLRFL